MKRFYKFASLGAGKKGHSILLDGKPVKTPSRNLLETPHQNLANAIVQEWLAQGEKVVLGEMHLTGLLSTQIDRVKESRDEMTAQIMKYLDTDLLCYRTVQPPELAERQAKAWDPWLQWFEKKFGAKLQTTTDLKALKQPQAAHDAAFDYIANLDDETFTVMQTIVPMSGSLVMALAFADRAVSPEEVFAVGTVEERYKAELYNEEQYGPDPSQEKKDRLAQAELAAAAKFLDLLS